MSHRNPAVLGEWGPNGKRAIAAESYWKQPLAWDKAAKKAGERRRVFCASLADVFEDREDLDEHRFRLMRTIASTTNLDWLLLTKRPQAIERILKRIPSPLPGFTAWDDWCQEISEKVWLGTSVEDQQRADERIPALLDVPAAVRFLSVEPLLEDIWFPTLRGIDWVIIGGESGHGARPCDLSWIRSIRDQCRAHGTATFVKQLGAKPLDPVKGPDFGLPVGLVAHGYSWQMKLRDSKGGDESEWPHDLRVREFPK